MSGAKPGSEQCLPLQGKQPHERASFAGWRRSLCAVKRSRPLPTMQRIKGVVMARLQAGHARPLQGGVNELRAKARPTECGKVGCRAACPQAAADVCGNEKPCGLCCRGRRPRRPAEGSRPLPTMQKIKGRQWQGRGPGMPGPYELWERGM